MVRKTIIILGGILTIIGQGPAGAWAVTAWNATLNPAECEAAP